MILFVNESGEIKDVNETEDESLQKIEIPDEKNPFDGWSTARLLCYRVEVEDGDVVMFTPYVDTRIVDQLSRLDEKNDETSLQVIESQLAMCEQYEEFWSQQAMAEEDSENKEQQLTDTQLAMIDIDDRLFMLEEKLNDFEERLSHLDEKMMFEFEDRCMQLDERLTKLEEGGM